jgi:formyltetrahydrofolate deformylase
MAQPTATLLVTCPERKGLVARLASFVAENGGNILQADHHTDTEAALFLSRIEWELDGFGLRREEIDPAFRGIARTIGATWRLLFSDEIQRIAIFVTKQDHCLLDLLWRTRSGDLNAIVPLVVGNHPDLASVTEQFGARFHHIPVCPNNRDEAEQSQLALLKTERIDLVVLAKYMQVLSNEFLAQAPTVINIHHSFLPAFIGDRPYHKAHARGVKLIGATAHYASPELDEGPIIEQEVTRVSHRDNVADLVRRGKDVERLALSRAVRLHVEGRVMVYGNRTVVFE